MPELPEVETYKRYLESTSLGKHINRVKVRDSRILELGEKDFIKNLQENTFKSVMRHGKYLFIAFDLSYLVMHFGMTGDLEYYAINREEPKYSKVLFEFTNNHVLSYISIRMFGKLDIADDVKKYIKEKKLGPDALKMSFEDLTNSLKRRTTNIKTALMNQEIVCGIGNIYSDEIIFRTNINPLTKINHLEEKQLRALFSNIKDVLQYGIEKKGELSTYSDKFLIPHRNQDDFCPVCHTKIKRYEILGRHGFFCPSCQKQ